MSSDGGTFGERLRACRAAAGLSQEELAERSGVSVRAIGDMERGRTRWPNRDSARRLADALGLEGGEREGFLALARRPVAGPAEPGPVPVTVPYRGLSAFGEQDAGLFFGREEAAARVLGLMSASLCGAGLVVVSGVSGAGKSSLLRAGVLPGLRQAGLAGAPEAAAWPTIVFTPGVSPVTELAVRVAPLARADAAALRRQLAIGPTGFAVTARQAALAAPGKRDAGQRRVVLVVDQCEQLFTACPDLGERQAFVTALCAAAAGDGAVGCPAAVVVLAVRADFEARLADFGKLAAAVQDRYLLTAMTRRQLRLAITGPATATGSAVAEDLVGVLLEEAVLAPAAGGGAAGTGALPLLSHALYQAWRTRTGTTITLADYERAGGIEGAVTASAERAYQALTPAQQEIARQVFTRLTAAGADGTDTAVPAARADLTAGSADRARDAEAVLERFAAERLLTLGAGTVQISHEVLLSAWPLLRDDWLAQAHADRITRTRLHATVTEWARADRDSAYLYTGTRLDAAAAAAARVSADPRQPPLSQTDHDFLHASHRASRRRARTRRQLTAVLLALIAALTTVLIIAVRAGQTAAAQRDIAASDLLIAQALDGTDPVLARQDSLAAWALAPSPQARYAMIQAAANPQDAAIFPGSEYRQVAFSPDGKTLATIGSQNAQLWDVATRRQVAVMPAEPGSGRVGSVAFSPDGKTLAVGTATEVQLLDTATGRQAAKPLPINGVGGWPMAFSPDGRLLAGGSGTGDALWLWDLTTGHQIDAALTEKNNGSISSVAFSPDSRILATGGMNGLWLLNVATSQQIIGPVADAFSVAFSPDGRTLAAGGIYGTRLWNLSTRRWTGPVFGAAPNDGEVVAFSPDGTMLAVGGGQGVQLWDLATGSQIGATLTGGNNGPIGSLAFSPDGKTLAAGTENNTLLWDLTAAPFRQFPTGIPRFSSVMFSPDGKTIAVADTRSASTTLWEVATGHQTGKPVTIIGGYPEAFVPHRKTLTLATSSRPGGVRFWDATTGQLTGNWLPPTRASSAVLAFSPDGMMVATASGQVWDLATGHPTGVTIAERNPLYAAFSPDGTMLAITDTEGILLWNLATGHLTATLAKGISSYFYAAAVFSPDGTIVATMGGQGLQLWNLATGSPTGRLLTTLASGPVYSAAFSPDGKTLATISDQGVQLWNLATGSQIGATLTDGDNGPIQSLAFSPDGKTLATTSPDRAELWDVSYLTETLPQLCSQAGGSLTPAEWAKSLPLGTPYRNPCPASANG